MKELFQADTIAVGLKAKNKEQVIDEMVALLDRAGTLRDAAAYKEAIYAREELSSTGIGFGIAIPHDKSSAVREARVAVGISADGIDYSGGSMDKVRLVFMIAVQATDNDLHLRTLASLSRRLIDPVFRNHLAVCEDPKAVLQLLRAV